MIKIVTKAKHDERMVVYLIVNGSIEQVLEDYYSGDLDEFFGRLDKKYDLYFIDKHDARQYLRGI